MVENLPWRPEWTGLPGSNGSERMEKGMTPGADARGTAEGQIKRTESEVWSHCPSRAGGEFISGRPEHDRRECDWPVSVRASWDVP